MIQQQIEYYCYYFVDLSRLACGRAHICMTVLLPTASLPHSWFSKCTDKEGCLLPGRSRKGSCWLWEVLFCVNASSGGETASWVTARDWETQQLSVSPARAACCLLRLIPQWNPSTNPIDGPPLLYQPKQNSLLTTSPSLVEQQDESLFWIFFFFFFFLQGGFIQQPSIFYTQWWNKVLFCIVRYKSNPCIQKCSFLKYY